jgi:twitching motility protein PilT
VAIIICKMNQTPKDFWSNLVKDAINRKATDILFSRGQINFRVDMDVVPYEKQMDLASYKSVILWPVVDEARKQELEGTKGSVDFGFSLDEHRFRFNIYRDYSGYSAAARPLPSKSYRPEEIGISRQILRFISETSRGLILVTGPTGSGKSSTICSLIEHLNQTKKMNILTIEDPIEYMFKPQQSIIQQREIGAHVPDFAGALRAAMRQNPDVIFVGEIRDLETAQAALQAADTGHLVFSTLHTQRVFATISRLIEIAPANKQSEIRSLLANTLTMVMGQRLLRKKGGGIVAAREILINTPAAGTMIRTSKEKSLSNVMVSGRDKGMIDWESCISGLYKSGIIDESEYTHHKDVEL